MRAKGKRLCTSLAALVLILSLAVPALPVQAASDSLTIKVGYKNYMSILEALTECVLEVEKSHAEKE